MSELRNFVYINEVSLNSNLSSLGRGVPAEITRSSEDETEKSGEAGAKAFGIGTKGQYTGFDRNATETTLEITAPYRFQDLLEALDEHDIDIYKNPDPRSLARGDVVRIDGVAKPMSLFKFELAIKVFLEIIPSQPEGLRTEIEGVPNSVTPIDMDEIGVMEDLIERYIGHKLPLRMKTDDWAYGVALDREHMRIAASRAFVEEQEYILFGRVNQRIVGNASWDPIHATSILDRYFPEELAADELRDSLEEVVREMNISMEQEDWKLPGHTATIQPIAMFW